MSRLLPLPPPPLHRIAVFRTMADGAKLPLCVSSPLFPCFHLSRARRAVLIFCIHAAKVMPTFQGRKSERASEGASEHRCKMVLQLSLRQFSSQGTSHPPAPGSAFHHQMGEIGPRGMVYSLNIFGSRFLFAAAVRTRPTERTRTYARVHLMLNSHLSCDL